ncbi:MAG: proton-conducting transporter membrane subunit, partial [Candidatus Blochmannia sp. A2]|nr:proton-conducting transporter membrane subunit [Candidatus Blochmannia sp. A2]
IQDHQGFFYFNLMLMLTGAIGVFISFDLFLFFFFWEMMLIPMYFLISLWGNKLQNKTCRIIAANKFIIYMQLASLIMLS